MIIKGMPCYMSNQNMIKLNICILPCVKFIKITVFTYIKFSFKSQIVTCQIGMINKEHGHEL